MFCSDGYNARFPEAIQRWCVKSAFLLSYAAQEFGGGGENCTPDGLLCWQTPCCLGYAAFPGKIEHSFAYLTWGRKFPTSLSRQSLFKEMLRQPGI
jgi:hypothetical protein